MAQENLLIEEAIPVGEASPLSLQQEQLIQKLSDHFSSQGMQQPFSDFNRYLLARY